MTTKPKPSAKAARASNPPRPSAEAALTTVEGREPTSPGGKLGTMVTLLRQPAGATIAQLVEATNWQSHSVRGAMAGALKTRGLVVSSEKVSGVRVYRLRQVEEVQP